MMDVKVTVTPDLEATATASLREVRDNLATALIEADSTMGALRSTIVATRPLGVMTVDEMAAAIGRDRNYVDSVWSTYGNTHKGKQTRVVTDVDDAQRNRMSASLANAATAQQTAADAAKTARGERDRVVAEVYISKVLGPSAIAREVGIDRNHVLRIARNRGVPPQWRDTSGVRNQHTAN